MTVTRPDKGSKNLRRTGAFLSARVLLIISSILSFVFSFVALLLASLVGAASVAVFVGVSKYVERVTDTYDASLVFAVGVMLLCSAFLIAVLAAAVAASGIFNLVTLRVTDRTSSKGQYTTWSAVSLVLNIFPGLSLIGIVGSTLLLCSRKKIFSVADSESTPSNLHGSHFCTVVSKIMLIATSAYSAAVLVLDQIISSVTDLMISSVGSVGSEYLISMIGEQYSGMVGIAGKLGEFLFDPSIPFGVLGDIVSAVGFVVDVSIIILGFVLVWRIGTAKRKKNILGLAIAGMCVYALLDQNALGTIACALLLFSGDHEYRLARSNEINDKSEITNNS